MIRHLFVLLSCFLFLNVNAQLVFFGDSEPISNLNSPSGENYLFLDFDNSEIYVTREKHPDNKNGVKDAGDIWYSSFSDSWSPLEHLKFNDKSFAAPAGKTADGNYFLYHRVEYNKGRYVGGVYVTRSKGKPQEVDIPYFRNKSPLQTGTLSLDGRYLMLSLENSAGYGVDDLFMCKLKDDGTWTAPKNLGNVVNTAFQELTPFLAADNKTMYFSSNGRRGAGSFDIYQTRRLDDTWQNWSEPTSLGIAVNTSGAETSFMFGPDAEYAYYVSTQNSDGYGDVRQIKIKTDIRPGEVHEVIQLKIAEERKADTLVYQLVDKRSGVDITGQAIWFAGSDTMRLASNAGGLIALIEPTGGIGTIEFKAKGYLSVRYDNNGAEKGDLVKIAMESLETGNVITLDHVLFYRGTANFIEGSQEELDLVVEMLNENPEVKIYLKGHTDNVGNSVLNVQLSRERVLTVENYLFDQGISKERISGDGFGGDQPIASNETEETKKLNRRVEFEVIRD